MLLKNHMHGRDPQTALNYKGREPLTVDQNDLCFQVLGVVGGFLVSAYFSWVPKSVV